MKTPILEKKDIGAIFRACNFKDPDGLYADDVDIYEFADKIEQTIVYRVAQAERAACIDFVRSLNSEVAKALEEKRGNL
jgi:hypothetical protein